MEIISFGGGERQRVCENILREAPVCGRLLLLPIPTTRDKKYISGSDIPLNDLPAMLNEQTKVAGYAVPSGLFPEDRVYDASLDEDFLLENACLTAKGTLGYLLTHVDRDISELNIGVVGYGRIGKPLLRLLLLLGAKPIMLTTRRSVAIELSEMGIGARVLDENTLLSDMDIIINTAPARLIDEKKLSDKTLIIDLASGKVFDPCERLVKLSSVPSEMYPVSAGRLYASGILKFLAREGMK